MPPDNNPLEYSSVRYNVLERYFGNCLLNLLIIFLKLEYDFEESDIYECSDGSYIINSKITIDHLNEQLELNLPEGKDYDSLAGLILNSLGYIPKVGEIISVENYKIEIQKASIRQIELIRLSIT